MPTLKDLLSITPGPYQAGGGADVERPWRSIGAPPPRDPLAPPSPVFQPPEDGGFTGGRTPPPFADNMGSINNQLYFASGTTFDEKLRSLYQNYLGREPTQQEIDGHRNNPQGVGGVFLQMQQDPSFGNYMPQLFGELRVDPLERRGPAIPEPTPGTNGPSTPAPLNPPNPPGQTRTNLPMPYAGGANALYNWIASRGGSGTALGALFAKPAQGGTGPFPTQTGAVGASSANPWAQLANPTASSQTLTGYAKPKSSISLAEPPSEIWPGQKKW